MKASSAVKYLYVHTYEGGLKLFYLPSNGLTTAVCVSCRKMRRKVLQDGNSVNEVCACLYCTSIMRLK